MLYERKCIFVASGIKKKSPLQIFQVCKGDEWLSVITLFNNRESHNS